MSSHETDGARAAEDAYQEYAAQAEEERDFDAFCAARPELADELQRLHALEQRVVRAFPGASLSARLAERYGRDADPHVSLRGEVETASGFSSEVLGRLAERKGAFGRYVLKGEIGRGGQGAVVRVWDEDLRRALAMKVLLGKRAAPTSADPPPVEPRSLGRFLEEAQVTGQLDHPGIVPVHELGLDTDGRVYFTMKLVRGRTLKAVLDLAAEGKEGWTQTKALGVLSKVCEAMSYAHHRGVVHRDLKPANVMVGSFGEVYVMDWGLAKVLGREDSRNLAIVPQATTEVLRSERREREEDTPGSPLLTMEGDVVGTPAYMPPEQALGRTQAIGPHSDVYAVGAMLYHLIAGHMPYVEPGTQSSNYDVWCALRQGPPAPVLERAPRTPAELVAICERAMTRDVEKRYADMRALAADLSAYLEHRVVAAYETGAWAEARKWVKRNKPLAAALAAAVTLLVAGLATSLVFKARADENAESARLAQREAEARTADVLSLSAQKDLDDLVARADELWPPHPELLPEYERWLAEARLLLDGRPAAGGVKARPSLAEHERKLSELIARAELETDEAALARAREHPSHPALESARIERLWMLRMLDREPWPDLAEIEQALEQEALPAEHGELLALARALVGPESPDLSQVARGSLLAARALNAADEAHLPRALLSMAWAEARTNRLEEALAAADSALETSADPALQAEAGELRAEVARWQGDARSERERELEDLAAKIARLEVEVGERKLADPEDRWWLVQLSKLVRDLDALRDPRTSLMSDAVAEPFGWGVAKRCEFARTIGARSVEGPEARRAWAEASAAIAASPQYGGLALAPQMGLLPIGVDPESGLFEFAHLMTGEPGERGAHGEWILTEATGIVLVLIPGGSFVMGAQRTDPNGRNFDPDALSDESPVHEVELSPYFLSKYEMTQAQWQRIAALNPSHHAAGTYNRSWNREGEEWSGLHPVEKVSWLDCMEMVQRLGLSLPSEAQWERAARAGTDTPLSSGETPSAIANLADAFARAGGGEFDAWETWDDGHVAHAPVGVFRPNPFGLHDVHGNVWEWCLDGFLPAAYAQPPGKDPVVPWSSSVYRTPRGGGFRDLAAGARSARRSGGTPEGRRDALGLRPARSVVR